MRQDEGLTDWIGAEAERRLLKIPAGDVPRIMEWVMYITGCLDVELIDETATLLTGMNDGTIRYGEFRNSVLYHEARKRHRKVGHDDECIADTAYSKAVKRVNDSLAPELPCECGGVPQPGDWEKLRALFVAADWTATIKTLSDSAWMDLRRKHPTQTLHMAVMRSFSPVGRTGAYVYDPNRKKWFAVTEERLIAVAWQPPSRYLAAVSGIANAHVVPPPPYLHRLPEGKVRVPGAGSAAKVRVPSIRIPVEEVTLADLPVSMTVLTSAEVASARSLGAASGMAFLDAVLTWIMRSQPDPRVFLCEDLIARTASALSYLPSWYGRLQPRRRPTPSARKRRGVILQTVMLVIGADAVPPWPQETPAPAVEPSVPPEPPPAPESAVKSPDGEPSGGMRMETCQVLAGLFPAEFATLKEEFNGKQSLLKLKEKHYKLFSEIRRGLLEGRPVDEVLAGLPSELKTWSGAETA